MNSPEDLKGSANQPDSRTVHLFYNLAKILNLVVVNDKNRLEITPRIEIFTNLPLKEQFIILFDAFWNQAEYAINHGWGIEWFSMTTLGGKILGAAYADAPPTRINDTCNLR
ncbi:MAG: hypothetical protein ACXQTY_05735 [Candidatus Methanogasteraceae archaeon]